MSLCTRLSCRTASLTSLCFLAQFISYHAYETELFGIPQYTGTRDAVYASLVLDANGAYDAAAFFSPLLSLSYPLVTQPSPLSLPPTLLSLLTPCLVTSLFHA